jgi:phospholipase C
MNIGRRDFFRRIAEGSSAAVLGSKIVWPGWPGRDILGPSDSLPAPAESGIKHIVVVTMENRSFDHFLGWLPNADGKQTNAYPLPNAAGQSATTFALAPDYRGCGHPDPDHTYAGGRIEYGKGNMDGWLLDTANDEYSIGYYQAADIPFLAALAQNYTTLDKYFCSILAPTLPNRFFMLAAKTDRLDNTISLVTLPTIFDRLHAAGISARYYYSNLPFLALWGFRYLLISRTYDQFLYAASTGRLPAVSFLDPAFTILDDDTADDDQPHTDIRRGDAFLAATFGALANGPAWSSTVLIITFDEWGGFFDHVPPPRAVAPNNVDTNVDADGSVHTSILKLIEWRWGVKPLTARDASADTVVGNLATVLNFEQPSSNVPELHQPVAPAPSPCFLGSFEAARTARRSQTKWSGLMNSGLLKGWRIRIR